MAAITPVVPTSPCLFKRVKGLTGCCSPHPDHRQKSVPLALSDLKVECLFSDHPTPGHPLISDSFSKPQTSAKNVDNADGQFNRVYIFAIALTAAMGGLMFGYDWVVIGGA
jgi:hypothetical protein